MAAQAVIQPQKRGVLISISGGIATGKTRSLSVIDTLTWESGQIFTMTEPVDKWAKRSCNDDTTLQDIYYAFNSGQKIELSASIQLKVIRSIYLRCQEVNKMLDLFPFVIVERNFLDMTSFVHTFMELNILPPRLAFQLKELIFDLSESVRAPDLVFRLTCTENCAMQRIAKRGRQGESEISVDYLKMLNNNMEKVLYPCKCIIINTTNKTQTEVAEIVLDRIKTNFPSEELNFIPDIPQQHNNNVHETVCGSIKPRNSLLTEYHNNRVEPMDVN